MMRLSVHWRLNVMLIGTACLIVLPPPLSPPWPSHLPQLLGQIESLVREECRTPICTPVSSMSGPASIGGHDLQELTHGQQL